MSGNGAEEIGKEIVRVAHKAMKSREQTLNLITIMLVIGIILIVISTL